MKLLRQLRERAFAVDGHVRNNVALDNAVLVRNALQGIVFVLVEKLGVSDVILPVSFLTNSANIISIFNKCNKLLIKFNKFCFKMR